MTPRPGDGAGPSGLLAEDEAHRHRRIAYLDLGHEDCQRLVQIGEVVADLVDLAVERFYEHIKRFELRALIADEHVLARLKGFQRQYLLDIFSGRYDAAYFQSRFRIGETHVRIGLDPEWYLGMYGIYRSCFLPRILERFGHLPDRGAAYLLALDKVLLLDGELALDAYIHAYMRDLRRLQGEVSERNEELQGYSARLEDLVAERTSALRLSEEKYRGIVDHAADAIIFIDNDDVIRGWNRGATAIFGYGPEEIVGRKLETLLPEQALGELAYLSAELHRVGFLKNFETTTIANDGRRVYVAITRTLLRNEKGEPIGSSAIMRDITAMRAFEERMYRAERLAGLGWLASEIAHEVGTPLNVISGRAEHLLAGLAEGDAKRRPLEIIVSQIERISRVMRRALQIARDPRETDGEASCDLAQAAQDVLEFFEVKLVSRRIAVQREIDPIVAAMNQLEMEQLLFNLIQNAIDAMPDGGTLTIAAHRVDGEATLSIADTGTGIAPENLERIFEPLFTTKESGSGTGLGLALVSRIVRRYRATIEVRSEPGLGTAFHMRLPVASVPPPGGGQIE